MFKVWFVYIRDILHPVTQTFDLPLTPANCNFPITLMKIIEITWPIFSKTTLNDNKSIILLNTSFETLKIFPSCCNPSFSLSKLLVCYPAKFLNLFLKHIKLFKFIIKIFGPLKITSNIHLMLLKEFSYSNSLLRNIIATDVLLQFFLYHF